MRIDNNKKDPDVKSRGADQSVGLETNQSRRSCLVIDVKKLIDIGGALYLG